MTNSRLRKLLLPLLKAVKEGRPISFRMRSAASQAVFLIGKGIKKPSQGRLRRVSKRSTKNEETAKIREAVFKRAGGECEYTYPWGKCSDPAAEMDHWLGGSGRRRQKQAVSNCWALCREHHIGRTAYVGGVDAWNEIFRRHCEHYGYPVIEHIVHEPIARKAQ